MNNKTVKRGLFPYVFLLIFILVCLLIFNSFNTTINKITYDEFRKELTEGKIEELEITPKIRTQTYEIIGTLKNYKDNEYFELTLPISDEFIKKITDSQEANDFELTIKKDPEASEWLAILVDIVPLFGYLQDN